MKKQRKELYQKVANQLEELSMMLWQVSVVEEISENEVYRAKGLFSIVSVGMAALDLSDQPLKMPNLGGSETKNNENFSGSQ